MAWTPDPNEAVSGWTPDPNEAVYDESSEEGLAAAPVTLPPNEYDIVLKTRKVGYSGLSDDEKSYFDSKVPASTLAKGMTLDQIHRKVDSDAQVKEDSPRWTALFPTAMTKGAGPWTVARDIATLPLRTFAGYGAAAGELGGQIAGSGDRAIPDAVGDAMQAYMDAMQSPEASVSDANGGGLAKSFANMANDPTTLPMLAVKPGNSLLGILGKGALMGTGTYATHALDRNAAGADLSSMLAGETKGQILQDVLPTAVPMAFKAGQAALAPVAENFGQRGVEHAYNMVRSMIKPASVARGGQIAKGYEEGMRGVIPGSAEALDAGASEGLRGLVAGREIFPELVKRDTKNVPEIVDNYHRLKDEIDMGFEPALANLSMSGVRVPRMPILRAVEEGLQGQTAQGRGWPAADRDRALAFVKDQLFTHDDPAMVAFADRVTKARAGVGKMPKPEAYQVINLRTPPSKAAKDPTARLAELEALAVGERLDPAEYVAREAAGQLSKRGTQSIPLYKLPSGELRPLKEAMRFDPLTPRTAQNLKSNLFDEAFKRSSEQDRAKETAARIAGEQLKKYLTEPSAHTFEGFPKTFSGVVQASMASNAEVPVAGLKSNVENVPSQYDLIGGRAPTSDQVAALGEFKAQLARSQPIYAMQEAMKRADVAKNRYAFSLLRSAAGPVDEFRAWAQENPGMARMAYDFGKRTQGMQRFLTEPSTHTPIAYEPTGSLGDYILKGIPIKTKNAAGSAAVATKNAVMPRVTSATVRGAKALQAPVERGVPSIGSLLLRGYAGSTIPLDYPGAR